MSKISKTMVLAVAIALIAHLLCACESSPKDGIIKSKNDGSFDAGIVQSAEEDYAQNVLKAEYAEDFSSTDGSVDFEIRISEEILLATCQLLRSFLII